MALLTLEVPDGESCIGCKYRIRRTDIKEESYHCAIFSSRADSAKTAACKKQSINGTKISPSSTRSIGIKNVSQTNDAVFWMG